MGEKTLIIRSKKEQQQILSYILNEDMVSYCLVVFMLYYGLDLTAAISLRKDSIDYKKSTILVGKRTHSLTSKLFPFIYEINAVNETNPYLFCSKINNDTHLNRAHASQKLSSMLQNLDIDATPGVFKRTYLYNYLCDNKTVAGSGFEYLAYRKDGLCKFLGLSEDEVNVLLYNGDIRKDKLIDIYNCAKIIETSACDASISKDAHSFLESVDNLIRDYEYLIDES